MNWFDLLVIAIIILYTWSGIKQGLLAQLVGFIGFFAALFLSLYGSRLVSGWVTSTYDVEELVSSPAVIEEIFEFMEMDMSVEWLAEIAIGLIAFVVLFIILQIVLRLVIKALQSVKILPVVGEVNSLAGGGLGLLKGIIFVVIIVMALFLLPLEEVKETLQDSVLAVFVEENLPGMDELKEFMVNFYDNSLGNKL